MINQPQNMSLHLRTQYIQFVHQTILFVDQQKADKTDPVTVIQCNLSTLKSQAFLLMCDEPPGLQRKCNYFLCNAGVVDDDISSGANWWNFGAVSRY